MTRCWEAAFASSHNEPEFPTDSEDGGEVSVNCNLGSLAVSNDAHARSTGELEYTFCFFEIVPIIYFPLELTLTTIFI